MASEIERKFLVDRSSWLPPVSGGVRYRQGYLSTDPERTVRVRVAGTAAFLTVKGITRGIARAEYEYPIPLPDAEAMLDALCVRPLVEKTRYRVPFGGRVWEVDRFEGENEGLVLAEIELAEPDETVDLPPWVGEEVSHDPRFFNSSLSLRPYGRWPGGR